MALFKQKTSDNWWISIYLPGQPRKYVPAGTPDRVRAEALEKLVLSAMRGNLARERLIAAIDALMGWDCAEGVAVADLWALYAKTKPTAGEHTIRQRRGVCAHFTGWMEKHYPVTKALHEVTPQQAQAFSDWMIDSLGGKGKTHNNRMGHIRTVFKAVAVRANLSQNPFVFVEKASQADSVHGRAFTADEQRRIFEQCVKAGNDWLAVCMLAKYSGLRLIDLAGLKWEQVGDEAIELTPSKTRTHGIRVRIPIHSKVRRELRLLARVDDFVFPVLAERYRNQVPDSGFMEEVLGPLSIDRDGAKVSFHCWRHTFRTMMAAARVPQEVAMKLGGWTNEGTAEIYNHDFSQLEAAIGALE